MLRVTFSRMLAALAVLLLAAPVLAGELLHGRARVTDGDTLRVGGVAVRLEGIAAPELHEQGGPEAAAFLRELAEGREVVCELTGERTWGRRVGVCFRQGEDLAAAVIGAGLARDCRRYSGGRYASVEPASARHLPLPGYCTPR